MISDNSYTETMHVAFWVRNDTILSCTVQDRVTCQSLRPIVQSFNNKQWKFYERHSCHSSDYLPGPGLNSQRGQTLCPEAGLTDVIAGSLCRQTNRWPIQTTELRADPMWHVTLWQVYGKLRTKTRSQKYFTAVIDILPS